MKSKIQEIHLLRAFGALGVVLLHSLAVGSQHNVVVDAIRPCLGYVIPIFIFISGFALSYNYKEEYGIINFYKKRFGAVLWPYLIFANVYLLYAIHINYFPTNKIDIKHYFSYILFAKAYYHLWFFVILFQLYLLFPFLIKFYKKIENKAWIFLIFTLIVQIIWNLISDYKPRAMLGTIFPSLIFYFVLGMYVSSNYDRISAALNKINVFIPIALFISANMLGFKIISFLAAFWMFYKIAKLIKDKENLFVKFLNMTASFSLGIYLIHVFFVEFSAKLIGVSGFLIYLSALILSILFCLLISKMPFSKYLIGMKR